MLKNKRCFALLLPNKGVNLLDIVHKLALNHHIKFNKVKIDGYDEYSYVLYTKRNEFKYIYNAVKNKNIRFLWKDNSFFGMVDYVDDSGFVEFIYFLTNK